MEAAHGYKQAHLDSACDPMSHMPQRPEDAQHTMFLKTHSQQKMELRLILPRLMKV